MPDKYQLLHRYWGYDSFRPLQAEIVDSVVQGHDTLALLPTGGGKSLCYQLPALLRDGICLVVSPLVALMKDQVQQLRDRGLKAACIVSGMGGNETTSVLYNAIAGELKYLYVSPERLQQRMFIEHLRRMKVGVIAVDEAHCISQWGYDFRPPYLQIAEIRAYHPAAPLIALTATATREVEEDICRCLLMRDCQHFRGSFLRPNLTYRVWNGGDKNAYLIDLLFGIEGGGIVYVRNRRMTQHLADLLSSKGISAVSYHAGLETAERDKRQRMWMQNRCRVMVATNAFGMGIDKPDVRFVVHYDLPDSVEAYFQEAGRAGRDGNPAEAVLLCEPSDVSKLEHNLDVDFPSVKYIRNCYRALCNYYKLPMGSGADSRHDFDLADICGTYNLDVRRFYSACRFLEREGLIAIPDREETSSMLYIPLGRDELYRFQVSHMAMGNLLQTVIRLYPGLFMLATPIDERKVASRCFMEVTDVVAMLTQMHEMHIVEYRPCPTKPQILFLSPRIHENDLYLSDENYSLLYQNARRRMEAMVRYVTSDTECRSRQLLAYFDEQSSKDCGRCDVCLRKCNRQLPPVEETVRSLLERGSMSIKELFLKLEKEGYANSVEEVRHLLDVGKLYLDKNLFVSSR